MLTVSDQYKIAIDKDTRRITPKVLVYFGEIPTEFTGDEIVSLNLLEEAKADTESPLGAISSNEITITFDNTDHYFTPTNDASPYYNLLKPNTKVEAFLNVEIAPNTFEEIPLGTFFTAEWSEGTVTGYDMLYALGGIDVPMIKTEEDITVGIMIAALFDALGVANYSIDSALDQSIKIGWYPKATAQQALQTLCVAGNCSINVDRNGSAKASANATSGTAVTTMTDNNQILYAKNPQKYFDIYNAIKLTYCRPRLGERETILSLDDVEIDAGGSIIDKTDFSGAPIGRVERVSIKGRTDSDIDTIAYDAWSVVIDTVNPGDDETVNIEAKGYPLNINYRDKIVQDSALIAEWGLKELAVQNDLIQNGTVARIYAEALLALVSDPFRDFELEVRGNPALEIGDIVNISDPTDKIPTTDIVVERITLDYDGGLSGTIKGRRVAG